MKKPNWMKEPEEKKPAFSEKSTEDFEEKLVFKKMDAVDMVKLQGAKIIYPKVRQTGDPQDAEVRRIMKMGAASKIYREALNKANVVRDTLGDDEYIKQKDALLRRFIKAQL